jgi:hypothetical protein
MSEHGVTWADVAAAKAALESGSVPFIRKPKHLLSQGEALRVLKTPTADQLGLDEYPPIAVLFYLVSLGLYPPPELMTAALHGWLEYVNGGGEVELEDAFFGKPQRGEGNFAKRHSRDEDHWRLMVKYAQERKKSTALQGEGPAERAAGDEMHPEHLRRLVRQDALAKKLLENDELREFAAAAFESPHSKPTTK